MNTLNQVILVDEEDRPLGVAEKLVAHKKGWCHRAFSIFIVRKNQEWEILLQQRASQKYHSSNLWTNTCCSHPRPGEDTLQAGARRLKEELGFTTALHNIGRFHYIAQLNNGLIENEVDHVLMGHYEGEAITADPKEIQAIRWASVNNLKKELAEGPERFTPWFEKALMWARTAMAGPFYYKKNSNKEAQRFIK